MEGESSHSSNSSSTQHTSNPHQSCPQLKLFYFNARSIVPKLDELLTLVQCEHPDVICIVESWLNSDILDSEISIPGYQVFRKDRNRHGGGVLVYTRVELDCSTIDHPFTDLELLWLSIHRGNFRLTLGTFYRPPNAPVDILDQLQSSLQNIECSRFNNLVLLGDFNVDFGSSTGSLFTKLENTMSTFMLKQMVTEPTHFHSGGSSMIDLVFASKPTSIQTCTTMPPVGTSHHSSYHSSLLVTMNMRLNSLFSRKPHTRRIWHYRDADFEMANDLLDNTPWASLLSSEDVNTSWINWKSSFLKIMSLCVPSKTISLKKRPPWLSKKLLVEMKKRNALYRKAKRTAKPSVRELYKTQRNKVTCLLKTAKVTYYSSLNTANPKKFWSAVRSLNQPTDTIPNLSHNGSSTTNDKEKAETLNSFFSQCFNRSVPPLHSPPSFYNSDMSEFESLFCSPPEIEEMLLLLDTSKATGPDGVSALMLKNTATSIAPSLCELFNMSISSGVIPQEWKMSNVIPIYKSGGKTEANNYRPISLLCIVSKVLEKHIHTKMLAFLDSTRFLSDNQWGFRPAHSTASALASATHDWFTTLDSGSSVGAVFFDLKKAFDSVPHSLLLDKISATGLHPVLVQWIGAYLTSRSQRTVVGGSASSWASVLSGVPQGSILGPLLFIIYVNGIFELTLNSKLMLYADDMLLYRVVDNPEDLGALQQDIDTISDWVSTHHLTLNISKTKYMIISRSHSIASVLRCNGTPLEQVSELTVNGDLMEGQITSLLLNSESLEEVAQFKYLGVTITDDLSWSKQVSSVVSKARRILGMIYRKFYRFCGTSTLLRLYKAYVKPHLNYCSFVWDPPLVKDQEALESVQKFALRLCCKNWSATYLQLLDSTGLTTLSAERKIAKLCFLYKIVNNLTSFPANIIRFRSSVPFHIRSCHAFLLSVPHARTGYCYYSFVHSSCKLWNTLPLYVLQSHTITSFKYKLKNIL